MRLSTDEIDALVGVLDYYIPDLHAEIARSEGGPWREEMRTQEARLTGLRQKLVTEHPQEDQKIRKADKNIEF